MTARHAGVSVACLAGDHRACLLKGCDCLCHDPENDVPKCCQNDCDRPVAYRFTWPGMDEYFICEHHSARLRQVAGALDLYLQLIPVAQEVAPASAKGST